MVAVGDSNIARVTPDGVKVLRQLGMVG